MRSTMLRSSAQALAAFVGAGCASTPDEAPPPRPSFSDAAGVLSTSGEVVAGAVIVDASEPAYTVFLRIPEDALAEDLDQVRAWLRQRADARVVAWAAFQASAKASVCERVRKDDYADCDVTGGITELLRRYAGGSFGVTWNGGIAFTRNDYEHAKRLLAAWKADPGLATRPEDPRADPIHPEGHLGPLLGR